MNYQLPKDLLESWLTSLRSDKYYQTTGFLCESDYGYCAIGVLAKDYYGIPESKLDNEVDINEVAEMTDSRLPNSLGNQEFQDWITTMNDEYQMCFEEIADKIEQNVEAI